MNSKGFTLIELLVVVLIIGILSSVALPSYTKSVEKARLSESLVNSKAILEAAQRYVDMYPEEGGKAFTKDQIADVQLKGGSWDNTKKIYTTKLFKYTLGTTPSNGSTAVTVVTVDRIDGSATLYEFTVTDDNKRTLANGKGTMGAKLKANISNFLSTL